MKNIINSFKIQDKLNTKIWDNHNEKYILNQDVRKHLIAISMDFISFMDINNIVVDDILFLGSLANYNWSEFSDIDLHIVFDESNLTDNVELLSSFFKSKTLLYKETRDININGYSVELYAQGIEESQFSNGVYSVLHNEWLKEPKKEDFKIDYNYIIKVVKNIKNDFNKINSIDNLKEKVDALDVFRKKIKQYRKCGLEKNGELSNENIIFKYLRRDGFFSMLDEMIFNLKDEILSK